MNAPASLASVLAARIGSKRSTAAEVLDELAAEGIPADWLAARVERTPRAKDAPWGWAKAARAAHTAEAASDRERTTAHASAQAWAERATAAEAAGDPTQAAVAWNAVRCRAKDLGLDPVEAFGAPPLEPPTNTTSSACGPQRNTLGTTRRPRPEAHRGLLKSAP